MHLKQIDQHSLEARAHQLFGEPSDAMAMIAEAVRAELWARRVCLRRTLCDRIASLLAPVTTVERERLWELIGELERSGDITAGPSGWIAAAPLRVVRRGDGSASVFGGPSSRDLEVLLGIELSARGISRRISTQALTTEAFRDAIDGAGGTVLTPEVWSGLEWASPADDGWLASLDADLDCGAAQAPYPEEGYGPWRCYTPRDEAPTQFQRWLKPREGARLWKVRPERRMYWEFVWTDGAPPTTAPSLRLTRDDAFRTMFALDRAAEASLCFPAEASDDIVTLTVDAMLPRAEYRFLIAVGERDATTEVPRYHVPAASWGPIVETLGARLGVTLELTGDKE